jgi:hypothetical protein
MDSCTCPLMARGAVVSSPCPHPRRTLPRREGSNTSAAGVLGVLYMSSHRTCIVLQQSSPHITTEPAPHLKSVQYPQPYFNPSLAPTCLIAGDATAPTSHVRALTARAPTPACYECAHVQRGHSSDATTGCASRHNASTTTSRTPQASGEGHRAFEARWWGGACVLTCAWICP